MRRPREDHESSTGEDVSHEDVSWSSKRAIDDGEVYGNNEGEQMGRSNRPEPRSSRLTSGYLKASTPVLCSRS